MFAIRVRQLPPERQTELLERALTRVYGRGASCSADRVRFYVPVNLLAAD